MKMLASLGDVGDIQNGGDHTDASRAGCEYGLDIFQRDAADGKPRAIHICGGPANVVERDSRPPGLGGRGENGADGEVGGVGFHRARGLLGGVGA